MADRNSVHTTSSGISEARPDSKRSPPQPPVTADSAEVVARRAAAIKLPGHTLAAAGDSNETLSSRDSRPSIQLGRFLRSDSPASAASSPTVKPAGRAVSPPPLAAYDRRVSFDTFDNKNASELSFTLRTDHAGYAYHKHSRVFLCGLDETDYSSYALEWLVSELVDDGDQVVCFRVVDKKSKLNSEKNLERQKYRNEARKLMSRLRATAKYDEKGGRSISLVLEFAVGEVQKVIQRLIAVYEPASLVVGTRGRSLDGFQGLLPGSVSKYCLQSSPVPVIVVRPEAKREKKKRKRRADPSRKGYLKMVEQGGSKPMLTRIETNSRIGGKDPDAGEKEALAVAKAIGLSTMEATLKASMVADTGRAVPFVQADRTESEWEDDDYSDEDEVQGLDAILSQSLPKDPKPRASGDQELKSREVSEILEQSRAMGDPGS